MSNRGRFPRINIRSKNELAKHIADKSHPYQERLVLINDAVNNFSDYWYDSGRSEPEKEKFVRSAIGTPLGKLLKLLNDKVPCAVRLFNARIYFWRDFWKREKPHKSRL